MASGVPADILNALERALALDERHIGALVTLGEVLSDQDPEKGQRLLQTAIAQSNEPLPSAHLALGTALKNAGDLNGAVVEYRKAIQSAKQEGPATNYYGSVSHGTLAHSHMALAATYEEMGQMESSMSEYEAAIEDLPY